MSLPARANTSSTAAPEFDSRSEANIATLLPEVQPYARTFLRLALAKLAPLGVTVKIISGTRGRAEQDALYAEGRTAPGSVVTNARFGYSNHNFGIGWDIGLFRGASYLEDDPLYEAIGPIGVQMGLEWGGTWRSIKDYPHYNILTGKTMAQLRADVENKRSVLTGVSLPHLPDSISLKLIVNGREIIGAFARILHVGGSAVALRSSLKAAIGEPYTDNDNVTNSVIRDFFESRGYAVSYDDRAKTIRCVGGPHS